MSTPPPPRHRAERNASSTVTLRRQAARRVRPAPPDPLPDHTTAAPINHGEGEKAKTASNSSATLPYPTLAYPITSWRHPSTMEKKRKATIQRRFSYSPSTLSPPSPRHRSKLSHPGGVRPAHRESSNNTAATPDSYAIIPRLFHHHHHPHRFTPPYTDVGAHPPWQREQAKSAATSLKRKPPQPPCPCRESRRPRKTAAGRGAVGREGSGRWRAESVLSSIVSNRA